MISVFFFDAFHFGLEGFFYFFGVERGHLGFGRQDLLETIKLNAKRWREFVGVVSEKLKLAYKHAKESGYCRRKIWIVVEHASDWIRYDVSGAILFDFNEQGPLKLVFGPVQPRHDEGERGRC
jgi:hypothetical protein